MNNMEEQFKNAVDKFKMPLQNSHFCRILYQVHAFLFIRIYFIRILKIKWDKKLRIS